MMSKRYKLLAVLRCPFHVGGLIESKHRPYLHGYSGYLCKMRFLVKIYLDTARLKDAFIAL